MRHSGPESTAYRVGLGSDLMRIRMYLHRRDWRPLRHVLARAAHSARRRSWWGLWQSEADGLPLFARRGLTPSIAGRRMRHDADLYRTGVISPAQRRRLARTEWGRRLLTENAP